MWGPPHLICRQDTGRAASREDVGPKQAPGDGMEVRAVNTTPGEILGSSKAEIHQVPLSLAKDRRSEHLTPTPKPARKETDMRKKM